MADAGKWKNIATLITRYQHSDDVTPLAAPSEQRKRTAPKCDDPRVVTDTGAR